MTSKVDLRSSQGQGLFWFTLFPSFPTLNFLWGGIHQSLCSGSIRIFCPLVDRSLTRFIFGVGSGAHKTYFYLFEVFYPTYFFCFFVFQSCNCRRSLNKVCSCLWHVLAGVLVIRKTSFPTFSAFSFREMHNHLKEMSRTSWDINLFARGHSSLPLAPRAGLFTQVDRKRATSRTAASHSPVSAREERKSNECRRWGWAGRHLVTIIIISN